LEEEYTRRKQQRPNPTSKKWLSFVILLLFINTAALAILLFMNFQENSKNEERFSSIEKQVSQLDQNSNRATIISDNTEENVLTRPSTTQESQTQQSSSSTTESSTQQNQTQTTPSSTTTAQAAEPVASTYTVQSGDTLSVIAEKNNLSLQELMTKNNLTDATVYIGQVLSLQ
jgi:LysM repeat protein